MRTTPLSNRLRTSVFGALLALTLAATGCASDPDAIYLISREDGSGTRSAFVDLSGVSTTDASGLKVDRTANSAEITNSTAVMMLSVAADPAAIGYISLGSLDDSVKALEIDHVAPSTTTVADGSYPLARTFNIITGAQLTPAATDFIDFILSSDGQQVVAATGYVPAAETPNATKFTPGDVSGKVVVSGSSSVSPVMEALAEAYGALNPQAVVQVQMSDSTTGVSSIVEGIADIGMSSRELQASEKLEPITATAIARDGIAVIVNSANPISGLTHAQLCDIFIGELTSWAQAGR